MNQHGEIDLTKKKLYCCYWLSYTPNDMIVLSKIQRDYIDSKTHIKAASTEFFKAFIKDAYPYILRNSCDNYLYFLQASNHFFFPSMKCTCKNLV